MTFGPAQLVPALAILLGLTLGYELFAPITAYSVPAVRLAALPDLPAAPPPFAAPSPAAFDMVSDRPLFDPQRKKYVAPVAEAADKAAPPPPPTLLLVGIIIDSERRMAMIKSSETALASAVAVGAEIDGWQLAEIEPDRIVLTAGPARDEVRLDANKAPLANAQAQMRVLTTGSQTQTQTQQQQDMH